MTKRLILSITFLSILFCGCKKDESDVVAPTTYQIVNNLQSTETSTSGSDGQLYEVLVLCYNSKGDIIRTDKLPTIPASGGLSAKITCSTEIEKIKITYKYKYKYEYGTVKTAYMDQSVITYFYLKNMENITITIDKNTVAQ